MAGSPFLPNTFWENPLIVSAVWDQIAQANLQELDVIISMGDKVRAKGAAEGEIPDNVVLAFDKCVSFVLRDSVTFEWWEKLAGRFPNVGHSYLHLH